LGDTNAIVGTVPLLPNQIARSRLSDGLPNSRGYLKGFGRSSGITWNPNRLLKAIRILVEFLWISVGFPKPVGYRKAVLFAGFFKGLGIESTIHIDAGRGKFAEEEGRGHGSGGRGGIHDNLLHGPLMGFSVAAASQGNFGLILG
jgi:hypothetical protein